MLQLFVNSLLLLLFVPSFSHRAGHDGPAQSRLHSRIETHLIKVSLWATASNRVTTFLGGRTRRAPCPCNYTMVRLAALITSSEHAITRSIMHINRSLRYTFSQLLPHWDRSEASRGTSVHNLHHVATQAGLLPGYIDHMSWITTTKSTNMLQARYSTTFVLETATMSSAVGEGSLS